MFVDRGVTIVVSCWAETEPVRRWYALTLGHQGLFQVLLGDLRHNLRHLLLLLLRDDHITATNTFGILSDQIEVFVTLFSCLDYHA